MPIPIGSKSESASWAISAATGHLDRDRFAEQHAQAERRDRRQRDGTQHRRERGERHRERDVRTRERGEQRRDARVRRHRDDDRARGQHRRHGERRHHRPRQQRQERDLRERAADHRARRRRDAPEICGRELEPHDRHQQKNRIIGPTHWVASWIEGMVGRVAKRERLA
jgi:hypothetical protein